MREYEQAEALAARAVELSERNQFPQIGAMSRCVLGHARALLGRATEGVGLIRQSIARLLETGSRIGISSLTAGLAEAQEREGAIIDALETVEQALQVNPDELIHRPETLSVFQPDWNSLGGYNRLPVSSTIFRKYHGSVQSNRNFQVAGDCKVGDIVESRVLDLPIA
jgi:hypothetical protein